MSRRACLLTARLNDHQRASDEQTLTAAVTSMRRRYMKQYHHIDLAPDLAATRWTDAASSTSTDHQPHGSTVGEQGRASTTDGHTNVE